LVEFTKYNDVIEDMKVGCYDKQINESTLLFLA